MGRWAQYRAGFIGHTIFMNARRSVSLAAATILLSLCAEGFARTPALQSLLDSAGASSQAQISFPEPEQQVVFAKQRLPENNNEPGFTWPRQKSADVGDYVLIGGATAFLAAGGVNLDQLEDGTGKCALSPNTRYPTEAAPGFESEYMTVVFKEPVPGCALTKGYILMTHVAASSAGGAWQLPKNVRAFLDTLAYAEGTRDRYNYIFTFATFKSYADHPRKVKCQGGLCSSAAGRYQFLASTWDPLAGDLELKNFTPPNQDKAALEIIRRAGAYRAVENSADYNNFKKAMGKLNDIWASLPGSPYGQHTYSMAALWKQYKAFLAKYK
ncbi:MAG: glycoside hydrolase family 104 protein [Elusimicrobia bacterium]|nr:glycoside hydrolase family 104 protein [Elusimicrobiota bacterium]